MGLDWASRAIYLDADVILVDDPLSAVDSKVGREILKETLQGLAVNQGKCVILATHQHQYVQECKCVMMENGRLLALAIMRNILKHQIVKHDKY